MITKGKSGTPDSLAIARAEPSTAWWMMAAVGIPAHSSSIASRKLRAEQLPQPPMPAIASEVSEVRRAQSAGSGGTETDDFRTRTAARVSSSRVSSS